MEVKARNAAARAARHAVFPYRKQDGRPVVPPSTTLDATIPTTPQCHDREPATMAKSASASQFSSTQENACS